MIRCVSRLLMVAEVGFEPHDLRVMSPTSYQAALLRDIEFFPLGAGDRGRTGTILSYHGILSPGRLPVPPHRRSSMAFSRTRLLYHLFGDLSTPFLKKLKNLFRIFFDLFRFLCFLHDSAGTRCIHKIFAQANIALQTGIFARCASLSLFKWCTLLFRC